MKPLTVKPLTVKPLLNSPFRWVGGKSRLRKFILPLIPEHQCYVEPFAGAAWVLFGKPASAVEVLNDIDDEVMNFFRVVKHQPQDLVQAFEFELVGRSEFNRLAALDTSTLTTLQRAHRFYYLIMAGWGGELNYPRLQTSISDGGHGNRLIGALATLQERLRPVHQRLSSVLLENLSWEKCIERYDRPGVFMYIDPPYPDNKCNYANNMRDMASHERLAERLSQAQCQWMLSSYDNDAVRALYPDGYIVPIAVASGMECKEGKRVTNREILVMNYIPKSMAPLTA